MQISTLLEKLIIKKFYAEKSEIENKLNVFYAMSKLTDEEYSELTLKLEEVYRVIEETTENTEENEEMEA